MDSGIISFAPLFAHIKQNPEIPHKKEPTFLPFKEIYSKLADSVPNIPGWYVWVQIDGPNKSIIYIGQSQTRKTSSLQARIREEFLDEFVALWATIHGSKVVSILDSKYNNKYTKEIARAARKSGATHLIWFGKSGLSDIELDAVEHNLISNFNPTANKRSSGFKVPFPELFKDASTTLETKLSEL